MTTKQIQTLEVDSADGRCGQSGIAAEAPSPQGAEGSLGPPAGEVEFVADVVELC
jgi:hypothetical protein